MDDWQLVEEFRARNSEQAFASLVTRYLGLVYSSALRQVADPHLAEEVTQSVFLLLARKARSFRRDVILAGWLFRTTRFVASRTRRSEMRRKTRDQEALEMQEFSAPDETWQRIAPLLDEALDQLSDSDRNTVLLRFMGDNSLRETGVKLGISEEAAKKRVKRALEKLRTFFQRRGFAVSTVVLAGALSKQLASAAPVGLASSITAAAMSGSSVPVAGGTLTSLKIAAGIAAIAVAVALLNVAPWRKPIRQIKPASANLANAAISKGPAASVAPNPVRTPALTLRVVTAETGRGVPGAKVFAQFWHDFQVREFATGPNGACEIPMPATEFGRLDLGALTDGHVQKHVVFRKDTVWPVPGEFTLKLERAVSAGGWVRDEAARAVPNAEITFIFPGRGDYSGIEASFERLGFAEDFPITNTDASGHWACAILPPNYGDFSIRVAHPSFLAQSFATDRTDSSGVPMTNLWAGDAVLMLKDRKPLTLAGRVVDLQGRPIAGAKVGALMWADKPAAITDHGGNFQLTKLGAGTHGITASAPGFAPERVSVDVTSQVAPVMIQLKPGSLLRLRVVDENQSGVAGATVALSEWRDRHAYDWRGNTDASGYVEWPDAPAEPMKFDVFKTGYFRTDEQATQPSREEHTLTLRRALRVTGQVTDAETGQRIPKFKVIPGYQEPDSRQWFRSDFKMGRDGYYDFSFEVWRPPYTVRIEADGYEVGMSNLLQADPREQVCDFVLKPLDEKFAIKGTVFLPDGKPAKVADVALADLDHYIRLGRKRLVRQRESLVTNVNERGEFAFPADPNAHMVVALANEGFAMTRVSPGELLKVHLQPWGRIEGTVLVPNPENRSRSVRLSHQSGSGNVAGSLWLFDYAVDVDSMGHFVFGDAPPGEFSCILYNHKGIPGHSVGVNIKPGAVTDVEIGGSGAIVTGRLKPVGTNLIDWGQPRVARLEAEVPRLPSFGAPDDVATLRRKAEFWMSAEGRSRSLANRSYALEIAPDGSFAVPDVPVGNYRFVVVFPNASLITNITIPDESPVDLGELVLR